MRFRYKGSGLQRGIACLLGGPKRWRKNRLLERTVRRTTQEEDISTALNRIKDNIEIIIGQPIKFEQIIELNRRGSAVCIESQDQEMKELAYFIVKRKEGRDVEDGLVRFFLFLNDISNEGKEDMRAKVKIELDELIELFEGDAAKMGIMNPERLKEEQGLDPDSIVLLMYEKISPRLDFHMFEGGDIHIRLEDDSLVFEYVKHEKIDDREKGAVVVRDRIAAVERQTHGRVVESNKISISLLPGSEVTLGRSSGCDVKVQDLVSADTSTLSRKHLLVIRFEQGVFIAEIGSNKYLVHDESF